MSPRRDIPRETLVSRVAEYRALLQGFLNQDLNAAEFKTRFSAMWKEDGNKWDDSPHDSIDDLFVDVDVYRPEVPDDAWSINEDELRRCAERTLRSLENYRPPRWWQRRRRSRN